ncbi:MAG TPA: hypothetical protein VJ484_07920 [Lysobacter sp.]|nr:hypothetical protein [Lysobacter sp.]
MRVAALTTNIAIFALFLLSGCAQKTGDSDDGEACTSSAQGNKVYITVTYDAGAPSVSPADCYVLKGTQVTLRTDPPGPKGAFDIEFKQQSASGPDAPKKLHSEQGNSNRQRIKLKADNEKGTYGYTIIANGIPVDPAIIIQ